MDIVSQRVEIPVCTPESLTTRTVILTLIQIKKEFPGALTNSDFVSKMTRTLTRDFGFKTSKTLLATSLCCDEVNRSLEHCLEKVYGQNYFVLGGLAGFPFAGITGLQAMASHVPDGGSALIIYGPHVGIDANGNVGSIDRRGREKAGACCGSAVAAARSVLANSQKKSNGKRSPSSTDDHILSSQQQDVEDIVRTYADHLRSIDDPMVELPYCLFESQSKLMDELVESSLVTGNSIPVAMVGGIQINTDIGQPDYFLPIRFEVRDASGVVASGGI